MRAFSRRCRSRSRVPNSPPSTANTTAIASITIVPRRLMTGLRLDAIQRAAGELGGGAKLLLDAQQLVVLRDAIRPARRAGLDLAGARRDGEVGDEGVLGLARAV